MTTKSPSGTEFLKQNDVKVPNHWTLSESVLLQELLITMVKENALCDTDLICEFYLELTQAHRELKLPSQLNDKTELQIKLKIKDFEAQDAIFRATVRSQMNLID